MAIAKVPHDVFSYILMKDVLGEKGAGKFMSTIIGSALKPVQVLRGELLTSIRPKELQHRRDGTPAQNFRVKGDPTTTLYGGEDDEYVTPLNERDLKLLEAIRSKTDRFIVFSTDNKLEWGERLKKGDQVYVRLPGANDNTPTWSIGLIKYVGPVESLPGRNFGVEIKDSRYLGRGTTDGFFGGFQYFRCDHNCGVFVSLDKLRDQAPHQLPQSVVHQSKSTTLPNSLRPNSKGTPVDKPPPLYSVFNINDRVVVYDKKNQPKHGTVGWIGNHNETRALNCIHIGIEMDDIVVISHFPKVLTGVSYLFKAEPGRHLVVPESQVFRENLADTHKPSARDVDLSDPAAIAKEDGMTKRQFLVNQEKMLKEAEKIKKKEDRARKTEQRNNGQASRTTIAEIKNVLNESVDTTTQQRLMEQFKKKKQDDIQRKVQHANVQPGQVKGQQIQKQKSWQPSHTYDMIPTSPWPQAHHQYRKDTTRADHEKVHRRQLHAQHSGQREHIPHNSGTRPGGTALSQDQGMRHVQSHNQMATHNRETDSDYGNQNVVDEYLKQSQSNQTYQPPAGSQQGHYQNASQTYLGNPINYGYQQSSSENTPYIAQHQAPNQWQAQYFHSDHNPSITQVQHRPAQGQNQLSSSQMGRVPKGYNESVGSANPFGLAIGSAVQVASINPNDPQHYGVIRWIGAVGGVEGLVAGIELDEYMEGCTDGIFNRTGERLFTCTHGRGLYFPLVSLHPDERFVNISTQSSHGVSPQLNPLDGVPMEELVDQPIHNTTEQIMRYIGDRRGIQGHQNSCYLDSTIFGLFALNDIFDTMFLEPDQAITSDQNRKHVAELLWKGIVNPLRKNGVVRYESVMRMRNALDNLGKMEGIKEKEKDPEEFLIMLLEHVLHTKPFISIRRPFGVEKEFFVQLFVEADLRLPTVGALLSRMFKEQQISFVKVPSKLLIQVPRFGREFKMYQRIIPNLKINISELTDSFKNAIEDMEDVGLTELDLLSVICIETSHYVCFTRDPKDDYRKKWIFFDSMADRQYDTYNIPRVTDCTAELNQWVYEGNRERLVNTPPRQLPELVRRFTEDVYLCVYIQPDLALYKDEDKSDDESCDDDRQLGPTEDTSEIDILKMENKALQQRIDRVQSECRQSLVERSQLEVENGQLQQLYNEQRHASEEDKQLIQEQKQQLEYQTQCFEQQLAYQKQFYERQIQDMQQRLEIAECEATRAKFTQLQIPNQEEDSWNVPRREVILHDKLGHGAWGSVYKGEFRGQPVAVKYAHDEILYQTTIDQLKREIRIMALVKHPNLVRLIAAVVDQSVEEQTKSPLLVLELLDTDLRSAYQKKIVEFNRQELILIFRDVAYALRYLHDRQDPIIHRDVSAPNVLLQQIHPRVWRAKLSDFGSANQAKYCKTPAPGAIIYSAPETFPSKTTPKQTTKIDVYSYGYLLAEMIAKKMPSHEKREAMLSAIRRDWRHMHDVIISCTPDEPENRLTMSQVLDKLNITSAV